MEWVSTLALAMGASWVSGMRLYAVVATLGFLQRLELAKLPGELAILSNEWVIGVATVLFVCEFLADKVAVFDTAWDAVHTFIRIPAAAVLASMAFADYPMHIKVIAFLIGGGTALASHGTKAAARVAVNHSPEPFSNVAVSFVEDALAGLSLAAALLLPVVGICIVVAGIVLAVIFFGKISNAVRGYFGRKPHPQYS